MPVNLKYKKMGHITNASTYQLSVKLKWLSSWVALGNESIRNFRRHLILARLVANIKWMSSWMAHGNAYIRYFIRETSGLLVSSFLSTYGNHYFCLKYLKNNKNNEVNKKSGNSTTKKIQAFAIPVLLSVSARAFNKIYKNNSKAISKVVAQVKTVLTKKSFPPNITGFVVTSIPKAFSKILNPVLRHLKSLKSVKGFFVKIAGRATRVQRAMMKIYKRGPVTRSKKSANIRYATQGINLRFGYVGVKCSMMLSKELRKPMYYKFGFAIVLLRNNCVFKRKVIQNTPLKIIYRGTKTTSFSEQATTAIRVVASYPKTIIPIHKKTKELITIEALDFLIRSFTTYNCLVTKKLNIQEALLAHTYTQGVLNDNLSNITKFIPAVRKLKLGISGDFSTYYKRLSDNSQVAAELENLRFSNFPKFSEALALRLLEKTFGQSIIFLNPKLLAYFRGQPNIIDLTPNTDWDCLYQTQNAIIPLDIKNTHAPMLPKNIIYDNSENNLRQLFTLYYKNLSEIIIEKIQTYTNASQITEENGINNISGMEVADELNNLLTEVTKVTSNLDESNLSQQVVNWNNSRYKFTDLVIREQLPFNYLSYTPNEQIDSILPPSVWDTYKNCYGQVASSPNTENKIIRAYSEKNGCDSTSSSVESAVFTKHKVPFLISSEKKLSLYSPELQKFILDDLMRFDLSERV